MSKVPQAVREEFIELCRLADSDHNRAERYALEQIRLFEEGVRDVRLADVSIFLIDRCGFDPQEKHCFACGDVGCKFC